MAIQGPRTTSSPDVLAVPGEVFALVPEDAGLDPGDRDALLEPDVELLLLGPVLHRRP